MAVTLVTCVTNAMGIGPGHSCVDIQGTVYTFENQAGWLNADSGWLTFPKSVYLAKNEHRPVIWTTLKGEVNDALALNYITRSDARDDDYGGSGVCSSQAANAIDAAYSGTFDAAGLDEPYEIYQLAHRKGLVHTETMYWPGKDDLNVLVRTRIQAILLTLNMGFSSFW